MGGGGWGLRGAGRGVPARGGQLSALHPMCGRVCAACCAPTTRSHVAAAPSSPASLHSPAALSHLHCPPRQGNTAPLEGAVVKLQRTKRPERAELAALLPELGGLPVQPREGETLDRILRKFDRWAVRLCCVCVK